MNPWHHELVAEMQDIVVDSRHPASIARFWAATLDGYDVAPYDDAELARLRAKGIEGPEDDPLVVVEPSGGAGPRLLFQRVPEADTGKSRLRFGLRADDLEAEVRRLGSLGATVLAEHPSFVTLHDPEGNEFRMRR